MPAYFEDPKYIETLGNSIRDGVAALASENLETLVVQDVDLELLRIHRRRGSTTNFKDRRTDLYKVRFEDGREV